MKHQVIEAWAIQKPNGALRGPRHNGIERDGYRLYESEKKARMGHRTLSGHIVRLEVHVVEKLP